MRQTQLAADLQTMGAKSLTEKSENCNGSRDPRKDDDDWAREKQEPVRKMMAPGGFERRI